MPRCDGVESDPAAAGPAARHQRPGADNLRRRPIGHRRPASRCARYLTKDAGAEQIQQALQQMAHGQAAVDPAVQRHVLEALIKGPVPAEGASDYLPDGLTVREAAVLRLMAQGPSNAQIAERLFVNPSTAKTHINHLFAKTGVRDRAQAVTYAYEQGLT
jgi:DNA-binding NarL/FixJ family response regulator